MNFSISDVYKYHGLFQFLLPFFNSTSDTIATANDNPSQFDQRSGASSLFSLFVLLTGKLLCFCPYCLQLRVLLVVVSCGVLTVLCNFERSLRFSFRLVILSCSFNFFLVGVENRICETAIE